MSGGGGEAGGRGGKLYYWNIRATLHLILVCSAITVPHV